MCKVHRKTPVSESIFDEIREWGPAVLSTRGSSTGVFRWILWNTVVIKTPMCLLLWIRCNICIFKKGFIFMQSCIQNLVQHLTWRVFVKIANGFQFWTILPSSILDNWRRPEYASGPCKYVQMTFTWLIWSCLWNFILWCSLFLVDSQFKTELDSLKFVHSLDLLMSSPSLLVRVIWWGKKKAKLSFPTFRPLCQFETSWEYEKGGSLFSDLNIHYWTNCADTDWMRPGAQNLWLVPDFSVKHILPSKKDLKTLDLQTFNCMFSSCHVRVSE